ncbi:NAD-dependent deacylase [Myroides marinus]|uniref:SIR2 family NAD-dependent protein deacylase n=1 Tax=Myroides marinus TaxID=703342 RepID=UPI0007421E55|nr:NAD-dependent deacylase [Myroides marinus]KUF42173.1 NAD-dependent deacylase [Myroides marinus]MDM1361078.1 NAD-dependent deacylase [Myroides marinus]MDM1367066.1 NAD-dependent deacylase [Myroides marinus]MDM1373069.1 NAD-dependent deacylase [Myroides marinus]MDM1377004.1 NAD-dependent deacylase [Myroides marinus]
MEKRLVVLSGAGMSAESGIQTFRDAGGLWEGHDVMEVASPEGWKKNKELVLDFYNQRRRQLLTCEPNEAHLLLAELEQYYNTTIITQNVDDLHERAGSSHIIHLHGELLKVRSVQNSKLIYPWSKDLHNTDINDLGHKLRPHIVWFGEMVPELENAVSYVKKADIIIIIGTSMQVYPAASLIHYAKPNALAYYIDTNPAIINQTPCKINIIAEKASIGLKSIINDLKNNSQ